MVTHVDLTVNLLNFGGNPIIQTGLPAELPMVPAKEISRWSFPTDESK